VTSSALQSRKWQLIGMSQCLISCRIIIIIIIINGAAAHYVAIHCPR